MMNSALSLQAQLLKQAAAQRRALRKAMLAARIEEARKTSALLRDAIKEENASNRQHREQAAWMRLAFTETLLTSYQIFYLHSNYCV